VIRLTRSGVVSSWAAGEVENLRQQFAHLHYVRLPGLVESRLLAQVLKRIEVARFERQVHPGVAVDTSLRDEPTILLLRFLANSRRFFGILESVTGCERIGCFFGRVYRLAPGDGHYDHWHNDLADNRILAMSLNLSPTPYRGGVLELYDESSGKTEEVPNTGLGDALLFRLAPQLSHRVTDVEGDNPKTAFAGWFRSSPDLYAELKEKARTAEIIR
jgi:2OG-Fe(II) oxygenase superfamily